MNASSTSKAFTTGRRDRGQASIEAVCGIAVLILAALLCFQLLAAGYTMTVVDGAAEAGAVALVRGRPVEPAVRKALPGWARSRVSVSRLGERVTVRVRPPSPLASLADRLSVTSTAVAKPG
jgi:hypothetical protein